MKQKLPVLAGILLVAMAFWFGCKRPSALGYELLEDEYADYAFTDTIQLLCTIEREDSSRTSDLSSTAEYFLCGQIIDPEFGKYSSEIFALMIGQNLNPNFDTTIHVFDSIVLYLNYAVEGFYGDTLQPQTLRVFRVDGGYMLQDDKEYFSTNQLPASTEIGRLENFYPRPTSSDSLFEGIKGPYIKLTLDPAFGQELFTLDSLIYSADTLFHSKLRGLRIATTANTGTGAIMAFDLNNSSLSRMRLFYHQKSDSAALDYDFFFEGANKFTHFNHELAGSPAGLLIGQNSDEKIFVQGMQGTRVKIEFPYAHLLNDIAVNQAQLILHVADENPSLPAADQLVFTKLEGDTTLVFTSDVLFSFGSNLTGGFTNFGGNPRKVTVNGTSATQYRLTLSELFQHMVNDDNSTDTKNRTVYLGVYPRSRTANRAVLFGPKSATLPAKLELTYTRVK